MNILVTGSQGQLGRSLQAVVAAADDHYLFTDVCGDNYLDITDASAVRALVATEDIRCIVNCAAWTDVNGAETAPAAAEALNVRGAQHLAEAMRAVGGLLVHISTDYVFAGGKENTPYGETHTTAPAGVYSTTKLAGEQSIIATGGDYLILRTAWLYSEYGTNFVKTILARSATLPLLRVVADQCGTPTYAADLAAAIYTILRQRLYVGRTGIYHYTNEGVCSWYDFATAIVARAPRACTVVPCHSSDYPSPVQRPAYSVLDKTKIKDTFGITIPHWHASLVRCLDQLLTPTT